MCSHIDRFGRLMASRQDRDKFSKIWRTKHGQPRNSGELIVEDQWICREISKALTENANEFKAEIGS